ncbi:tetratricopeptide TPR_2 repeat protein [Pseudanabaena sp. ABRG5-3]|nr:tetratricopeptide TPR_2 repeat protein [Pseudanabaena sp. ABRG5-3]
MYFYLNPQPSYALPQQSPTLISSLDAAALYARGVQKQRKGDFKGAIADYTASIRLNPKNADAYFNRGFVNRIRELGGNL